MVLRAAAVHENSIFVLIEVEVTAVETVWRLRKRKLKSGKWRCEILYGK
jgi:hypothetical protein